ncbi:MAG: tripartite tricarboxylate transporter permease, partial [Hyphomicrobiaceae bacterium]
KEGGALVPTVAFGVPGSAGMAILLGAFLIHGLVPGPDMLTKNLTITYSMVWSIAMANILGAGLCYIFSQQFAKLATLRYTLILPTVLAIIYVGAFEASRNWGDLYSLLLFGVLGWTMKQLKWPRPPFILGFVLGDILERYLFISIERFGLDWLIPTSWANVRWAVLILFAMAISALIQPAYQNLRRRGISGLYGPPEVQWGDLFHVVFIGAVSVMLWDASTWNFKAAIVPSIVGTVAIVVAALSLFHNIFSRKTEAASIAAGKRAADTTVHMDLESDIGHLDTKTILIRATLFFGWMIAFVLSMATIGLIPTIPVFVIAFMRFEGREPWKLVLPQAVFLMLFVWLLFDQMLTIPWPPTLLGEFFPELKGVIPSV